MGVDEGLGEQRGVLVQGGGAVPGEAFGGDLVADADRLPHVEHVALLFEAEGREAPPLPCAVE